MALEQEIIELVRLSATESVGDTGFSSPWISIGSRSLIRIKGVSKSAKYFSQLFISIIALTEFGPWASKRCRSISCIIVSTRINRSILPIRTIVHKDNTWARNRQNYLARLDWTGVEELWREEAIWTLKCELWGWNVGGTAQKWQQTWESDNTVRCGSHWGGSLQNGLRDEQTYGTTLASAYVLCHLSAAWLQL